VAQGPHKNAAAVFAAIQEALTPYIGATMASTAAAAHCQRLGFDGPALDGHQIGQLLGKVALGLVIFLGEAKTSAVIATIRGAIDALEEAS
jgi:hypothetical protein